MSSRLNSIVLVACLVTASAATESMVSRAAASESETYFVQVQVVRVIPIKKGGVTHSIVADLRKIARASCDRANVDIVKGSSAIYDKQVSDHEVQYNAAIQCK